MQKVEVLEIYTPHNVEHDQPYLAYSGTPLNGHPWNADIHDITDNSESPDYPSIHFNTSATPE